MPLCPLHLSLSLSLSLSFSLSLSLCLSLSLSLSLSQVTILNDQLRGKDDIIDGLREDKASVEHDLATAQAEMGAAKAAHDDAFARERDIAARSIGEANARVVELQEVMGKSQTSFEQHITELREDLARERDRAGDASANAQQQMMVLTENFNDSQARCQTLQQQLHQYEGQQANLRAELDQLRVSMIVHVCFLSVCPSM